MRKLIIGAIIFYFLFAFLPVIECENDAEVREKVCELYGTCEVDLYYPMSLIIFDGCPYQEVSVFRITAITVLFLAFSTGAAYGIDYLYTKYRDI